MKNNTILIIGNGSSVAKKEFGAYIDKYEKIARINNYKIHGYEKHIGTKTDIWINGANSKLIKRKKYPEEVLVLIPSKILLKKQNVIENYVSKRLNLNINQFQISPINEIIEFEHIMNHDRLTTGLYAILWGLKYFDNVIIHGFDFFIDSKTHYFDSKIKKIISDYITTKGYKHNNKMEQDYVNKMILNEKIKKLEDCYDEK